MRGKHDRRTMRWARRLFVGTQLGFALAALAGPAVALDVPVGGDRLYLVDPSRIDRRVFNFSAVRDFAVAPNGSNDPRIVGATLIVQGSNPGDGNTGPIFLPPGTAWRGLGKPAGSLGYVYLDRTRAVSGVQLVKIAAGGNGGSLVLRGGGANWPYAVTQVQGPIHFTLTIGGEDYCASFVSFQKNEVGRVLALANPPPASCGTSVCGDGSVTGFEECDDGDTDSGDGCSSSCQLEDTAALCAGIPAVAGTDLRSVLVADGFSSPIFVTAPPLDPLRLFVVEQGGSIQIVKNGVRLGTPFLDIDPRVLSGGERGLLGLAFHPDYESNGYFFVNYTDNSGDTVVSRFQVSADPDVALAGSETILLTIDQPYSNHNGGMIAFGPDGYLYVGMGDGGGGGDPDENGQDDAQLLGKMLRIDVDVATPPYRAVPASNPNAGAGDPLGFIWAKGLRNPWRFGFDRANGDLYIGDVGQGSWEEVDVQPGNSVGGENYGWDDMEGRHCFEPSTGCLTAGRVLPVLEYDHGQGVSITGGYVYRGCRMPDLAGRYFYADFGFGFIRSFQGVSGGDAQNTADHTAELAPGGGYSIDNPAAFGEDARGEIYVVDYDGELYRIEPAP